MRTNAIFFFLLSLVFAAFGDCQNASAQSFQVKSDSATFYDQINGTTTVGTVRRDTTFYAIQRKDGWVKAVEPASRSVGWISGLHLALVDDAEIAAKVNQIVLRERDFKGYEDRSEWTPERLDQVEAWADEIHRLRGTQHPISAVAMSAAGDFLSNAQVYDRAETCYEMSLLINRNVYGDKSKQVAKAHLDMARIHIETGDLTEAGQHAKASAVISAALFGSDHPSVADSRVEMARALLSGSQHETALQFLSSAKQSYSQHLQAGDQRTTNVRYLMAYAYKELGQISQAIEIYQEDVDDLQRLENPARRSLLGSQLRVAVLKIDPSDDRSINRFTALVDDYRTEFSDPQAASFVASIQKELVTSLLENGSREHLLTAIKIADDSIRQLRNRLRNELWGISPEKQADYLSYVAGTDFFDAISLALDMKDQPVAAHLSMEWLINGKGLVNELQATQAGGNSLQRRDLFANVPFVSLHELQQNLADNTAYVDILRYLDSDLSSDRHGSEKRTARYAAWVVHKTGAPKIVDLGLALFIDDAVVGTRRRINEASFVISEVGEAAAYRSMEPSLLRTSQRIWEPIKSVIGDATNVIISPDQATWLLPWSALLDSDGSFVIENHRIRLELTGRDLLQRSSASNQPAVIFADPVYGDESTEPFTAGQLRAGYAPQLGASAREAEVTRPPIEKLTGQRATVLTGNQAAEAAFKQLAGPSVVMLSTHGFFWDTENQISLASQIQSDEATSPIASLAANPLLACGLLLADANSHTSFDSLTNDGVLTGVEIAAANLRGTNLAVLSACQTGVGTLDATNGAIGLRSAFHEAGAQCVVSSLWMVPDLSTTNLMESFFNDLASSRNVETALQSAQKVAIQTRRKKHGAAHPYFWAAFNVSGHTELRK
ncbi:MAG: CHAT domain-containing tetratricopeptide repeat protein [Pirellulaceae bacterium]